MFVSGLTNGGMKKESLKTGEYLGIVEGGKLWLGNKNPFSVKKKS